MTTKKTFEMVAQILRDAKVNHTYTEDDETEIDDSNGAILDITNAFVEQFAAENPRFNRERFFKACGYNKDLTGKEEE